MSFEIMVARVAAERPVESRVAFPVAVMICRRQSKVSHFDKTHRRYERRDSREESDKGEGNDLDVVALGGLAVTRVE